MSDSNNFSYPKELNSQVLNRCHPWIWLCGWNVTQVSKWVCAHFRVLITGTWSWRGRHEEVRQLSRELSSVERTPQLLPGKSWRKRRCLCKVQVYAQDLTMNSSSFCLLIPSKSSDALPCSKAQPTAISWEWLALQLQLSWGLFPAWESKSLLL